MSTAKAPRVGRPFIVSHTATLTDARLRMSGNAARLAHADLLLLSAAQGLDGRIPSDVREVQFVLQLDGGVAECVAALIDLRNIGKLIPAPDGDIAFEFLTDWPKTQADMSGSDTRAESNRQAAFRPGHMAGKHTEAREGCALCALGVPSVPPAPAGGAESTSPSEVAPKQVPAEAEVAAQLTACAVKAQVRDRCTAVVEQAEETGDELVAVYADLYDYVREQAPKAAGIKGIGEATLLNVVVAHAAHTFLSPDGTGPDRGTLNVLYGLRSEHGADVLAKIALGAKATSPVAYIQSIYKDGAK
jgi:hypothetical protein